MINPEHNSDPAEIAKFNALADDWWDDTGVMKTLHWINPVRLAYIEKHTTLQNQRIVDVGCGGGLLSEALALKGANVTGIDKSDALIQTAKKHAETQGLSIDYACLDIETLVAMSVAPFDILTCFELLEHVPDPNALVAHCARLVKPGGFLFFSTLNRNIKAYLLAILGAEYILRWLPKGTHEYKNFLRPSELVGFARTAHLTLMNLEGMHYHPIKKQFELCADISVNYLACFTQTKNEDH